MNVNRVNLVLVTRLTLCMFYRDDMSANLLKAYILLGFKLVKTNHLLTTPSESSDGVLFSTLSAVYQQVNDISCSLSCKQYLFKTCFLVQNKMLGIVLVL